jgi:uncharacterized membrane protein
VTGRLRTAVIAVAAGALAIAAFLVWERLKGGPITCPIGGSSCTTVQQSSYGKLLGVPVSTFGLIGSTLLLANALVRRPAAAVTAFALACGGAAFSLYLTWTEAFRIHAYCAWCLTSATLWVAAAVLTGIGAARATG